MSKGGLGFSRTIDSNFQQLFFRDFIPKLVRNNTVIDDEYEGITLVMKRANHVMSEMEKDGMEFVNIQTMIIPKGEKTRTTSNGKKSNKVSLSGRYRFDQHSKHPVDCFQIVRVWYRQKQGGFGTTTTITTTKVQPPPKPKVRKSVSWTDGATDKPPASNVEGKDEGSLKGESSPKDQIEGSPKIQIEPSTDSKIEVSSDNAETTTLRNTLTNTQVIIDHMAKRIEELETKMCEYTRNQQLSATQERPSSFRSITSRIAGSFSMDENPKLSFDGSSGSSLDKITDRISTVEKKVTDNHKKDQKIYIRLAEEINKNSKERKQLETSMNTKIKETGGRLWTSIQTLDNRVGEQAINQSVKIDSLITQVDSIKTGNESVIEVKEAQTQINDQQKEIQEKIGMLDKVVVKMRSEGQSKTKLASKLNADISTIEAKVNEHEKKLLIVESKTDSILEQKKSDSGSGSGSGHGRGPLGSVLRSYSAKTKQWLNMDDPNPVEAAKTFFSSVRPVLRSVASSGGTSVLLIVCNIPPDDSSRLRFPFPRWASFDSHSFITAKGEAKLHNLRSQLGTKKNQQSGNPALRATLIQLEKYIQAYQNLYRFVAYVDLPPVCFENLLDKQSIHKSSNTFLENVLDLEIQLDVNEKKDVTGDHVFMRESNEEFGSKWRKHIALLKKEENHLKFQIFRCSWT